eukprot:501099-Rhodomonas_salina.6
MSPHRPVQAPSACHARILSPCWSTTPAPGELAPASQLVAPAVAPACCHVDAVWQGACLVNWIYPPMLGWDRGALGSAIVSERYWSAHPDLCVSRESG